MAYKTILVKGKNGDIGQGHPRPHRFPGSTLAPCHGCTRTSRETPPFHSRTLRAARMVTEQ